MAINYLVFIASLLLTFNNVHFTQSISVASLPFMQFFHSEDRAESKIDISQFLVGAIEKFRNDLKVGNPRLKIPILDPYVSKAPIKIDVQDGKISAQGNFTDVHVQGLSTFIMDSLEANYQNLSLTFQLHIPKVRAYGHYSIDGNVFDIVPLRGNGRFRIEPENVRLGLRVSIDSSDEYLQLTKDFDVEIDVGEVDLNLENFVGGSTWDEVLETLKTTKEELLDKSTCMVKDNLNNTIVKVINNQLRKLPLKNIKPGSSANEYVDHILKYLQNYVKNKNLDPMSLPDYKDKFSKEIMGVNFNGKVRMFDGRLYGLSTIHRTDNCKLKTNASSITISANLGLSSLRIIYNGHVKFMSYGVTLTASGCIPKISIHFEIDQSKKKGAKAVLREFKIVEMSTLSIELSGLGPVTWIMQWLLTGVSKLVEDSMHEKMTDTMRGFIQNELQKYSFPV